MHPISSGKAPFQVGICQCCFAMERRGLVGPAPCPFLYPNGIDRPPLETDTAIQVGWWDGFRLGSRNSGGGGRPVHVISKGRQICSGNGVESRVCDV